MAKKSEPLVIFADYKGGLSKQFTSRDAYSAAYNYTTPQGDNTYHGICKKIIDIYETDDAVGEFVDKLVDFIVGNTEFRHSDTKVKQTLDDWFSTLNLGYANVLPSGQNLIHWIAKSLVLTAMATVSSQDGWGFLPYSKNTSATFPILMTVYPSTLIQFEAKTPKLGSETILLSRVNETLAKDNRGDKESKTVQNSDKNIPLSPDDNFCIKYRWTPLDRSLYPVPPLKKLLKIVTLRNRLIDGDMSVLEDLIMAFNWFEIDSDSNKANKYKYTKVKNADGTTKQEPITKVLKDIFTDKTRYMSFVLPPGWKFKKDQAEMDAIINSDKYQFVQSAIMNVFGFMTPVNSSSDSSEVFRFNLKRFEKLVLSYRTAIELYFKWMFNKINAKNPALFKGTLPELKFEPLRLDTDEYLRQVATLWIKGKLSDESSMERFGFDYNTEVSRRKAEQKNDVLFAPKITNPQTPEDGGQIDDGGRPTDSTEDSPRSKSGTMPKNKGTSKQLK